MDDGIIYGTSTLDKSNPIDIHFSDTKSPFTHGDALLGHYKEYADSPRQPVLNKFCGCAIKRNCEMNIPWNLEEQRNLLRERIEKIELISDENDIDSGGGYWREEYNKRNEEFLQAFHDKDKDEIRNIMINHLLTGNYHAHHPVGVNKTGNMAHMSKPKCNGERNRVIMLHNLCHMWEFTFKERGYFQGEKVNYTTLGVLVATIEKFLEQEQQCKGVLGTCILGYDTEGVEQLLILTTSLRQKIDVTIGHNWIKAVRDKLGDKLGNRTDEQIGDLIFLLAGFEGHHVNNKTKTGGWGEDSMKELGVVVCMWCHFFHSMILGHLKYRRTKKGNSEDDVSDDDEDDDDDDVEEAIGSRRRRSSSGVINYNEYKEEEEEENDDDDDDDD